MLKADVVIIGSEGAGARAAIEVARHGVKPLVLTKGPIGKSGATITAMADFEVDSRSAKEVLGLNGDIRDSQEKFFEDTLISGGYLNNQKMLERHVTEIPAIAKEMIEKNGGKNVGSISSKTSFILAGENMGPAKLEKAQKLGVKIMSEDEFLALLS